MNRTFHRPIVTFAALALLATTPLACTWRTEHKVETIHKIDAHIVLDIRQIKAEASQIEDYVRTEDPATTPTGDGVPTSWAPTDLALRQLASPAPWTRWLPVRSAAAAGENEQVTPAQEDAAKKARKERYKAVDQALTQRMAGENEKGYLDSLVPKDSPDKELRAAMDQLVRDENRDRRTIYLGLALRQEAGIRALSAIERIFAAEIREKLKKGQVFQAPKDPKAFEAFQQTKLGKAHAAAKPGEWIVKQVDPPKEG